MRISFLVHNAYAVGGTARTTANLAGALSAAGHDVEVVSVFRHRDEPHFALSGGAHLRHLVDLRRDGRYEGDHPGTARRSAVFPAAEHRYTQYSALTDERIGGYLAGLDADVVVGTRAGLNVHLARQAPARLVRVAQEHLTLQSYSNRLRFSLRRHFTRLDAVTTTTRADAAAYRRLMRLPGVHVSAIPNCVPTTEVPPSPVTAPVVVAAGRLAAVKRYDDLIRAFALVRAQRPEWTLRLYGGGERKDTLDALIGELGLREHVRLMGVTTPLEPHLAQGSLLVVSSSMESFGMTIVEAMRVGLPVVATDCPHGPREIIDDGVDGLLVPPRDPAALAAAMLDLIGDGARRQAMGRAALAKAARFDPAAVAERHAALFQRLLAARHGRHRPRKAALRAAGQVAGAALTTLDLAKAGWRRLRA